MPPDACCRWLDSSFPDSHPTPRSLPCPALPQAPCPWPRPRGSSSRWLSWRQLAGTRRRPCWSAGERAAAPGLTRQCAGSSQVYCLLVCRAKSSVPPSSCRGQVEKIRDRGSHLAAGIRLSCQGPAAAVAAAAPSLPPAALPAHPPTHPPTSLSHPPLPTPLHFPGPPSALPCSYGEACTAVLVATAAGWVGAHLLVGPTGPVWGGARAQCILDSGSTGELQAGLAASPSMPCCNATVGWLRPTQQPRGVLLGEVRWCLPVLNLRRGKPLLSCFAGLAPSTAAQSDTVCLTVRCCPCRRPAQAVRSQVPLLSPGEALSLPLLLLLDVIELGLGPPPGGLAAAAAAGGEGNEGIAAGGGSGSAVALLSDPAAAEGAYVIHPSAAYALRLPWLPVLADALAASSSRGGGGRLPTALPPPEVRQLLACSCSGGGGGPGGSGSWGGAAGGGAAAGRGAAGILGGVAVGDPLGGSALVVVAADGGPRWLRPRRPAAAAAPPPLLGAAAAGSSASARGGGGAGASSAADKEVEAQIERTYGDVLRGRAGR